MAVKVMIPASLQNFTNNQAVVEACASNIGELIDYLGKNFPGIKEKIYDEAGKIRRFVNISVNEEDIRCLKDKDTSLKDGDEVSIITAIAGG